jgi:hypothetical protein
LCADREAKDRIDPRGIRAHGARITGRLDLSYVVVPFLLCLLRCRLSENLDLQFIDIPALDLQKTSLNSMNADHATVRGSISLDGASFDGIVQMRWARIGGNLSCHGSKLRNSPQGIAFGSGTLAVVGSGIALDASLAQVTGDVCLGNEFIAEGQVDLTKTEIGGNLTCYGGKFQNADTSVGGSGVALAVGYAKIGRDVYFCEGFAAEGLVLLYGSEIGGNLGCDNGTFRNPAAANGPAAGVVLFADHVKVRGGVYLRGEFVAEGGVRLYGAEIGGDLSYKSEKVESLDLRNAAAAAVDDNEQSWPQAGKLFLDGFSYGRIAGGPTTARKRLIWLKRQGSFSRQPYQQLAKVLRGAGDDRGGRQVAAEMEKRAWQGRAWPLRLIGYLLQATIGYGYFSTRAIWWLLGLVIVGSLIYDLGYEEGGIVPTDRNAYESFVVYKQVPGHYEAFHSLPYSLENSFPFVKLGIQDKWAPRSTARDTSEQRRGGQSRLLFRISSPRFLRWFRWGQICTGWLLATLFVGGVSGLVRKG